VQTPSGLTSTRRSTPEVAFGVASDGIELSAEQIERLDNLTPATGERHEEANMAVIDR